MSLTKHLIHDEANTSVVGDVHKQLDITQKEYERKRKWLRHLVDLGRFEGSRFCSCVLVSELTNRLECRLYTHDKAALNLVLTRYNGSKFFFGTRGSPMRVLTGQNIVEHSEHARVVSLSKRLGCSLFEARTIVQFELVRACTKEQRPLGFTLEEFFSPEELEAIYARKMGVYSIGFARYVNFGIDRDDTFHMLSYLATQTINMAGVQLPLITLLGNLGASTWEGEKRNPNSRAQNTSLLLQKRTHGTSISFQQMLYIKEAEVAQKGNDLALLKLSVKQQTEMYELIRVDNTFFKPFIKEWLVALGVSSGQELMLCDVAPLFDNPRLVQDMCDVMSHELGVKLFLLAPTPQRIEFLAHESLELTTTQRKVIQDWIKTSRLRLQVQQKQVTPYWDSSVSTANSRVARMLYQKFCLDIRVPYDFYVHLDQKRGEFHYTELEALAASDAARNFRGRYSLAHRAEDIQERVSGLIADTLTHIGKSLRLGPAASKRSILLKHDLV